MRSTTLATLSLSLWFALAGCGDDSGRPGDVKFALTGASGIQLFDAQYTAFCQQNKDWTVVSAIVVVYEIDAKVNGAWVPIEHSQEQIDLLKLDDTKLSTIGVATIPKGKVTELRLVLDPLADYVVLKNGDLKPLTVPDDGIVDIDGKIDLDSCAMGTLIVDFDPHISTFTHPGLHDYILNGTAQIKTREIKNGCAAGPDMASAPTADMSSPPPPADMAGMTTPPPDMVTLPPPPDMTPTCTNVHCGPNQVCSAGQCILDPCIGKFCPTGDVCQLGVCVPDPCSGKFCPNGTICVAGQCM